jgi:hypothetical protein
VPKKFLRRLIVIGALVLIATVFCGRDEQADQDDDIEGRLEKLRSVPYTSVTSEKVSADTAGVVLVDRDRAWPGYNFYCSRVTPEAFLMDMDGRVVHTWRYDGHEDHNLWDHAIMLENGDIIVLDKFRYILQLDWESNLVWDKKLEVHHDVARADDGTLFVIEYNAERHRDLRIRFTRIVHLSSAGEEISRWSTYEHLDDLKAVLDQGSFLDTTLDLKEIHGGGDSTQAVGARLQGRRAGRGMTYDYFHLNTITILPETPLGLSDARFAGGNLLICLRNVNQIATLNWETGVVLWGWGEGALEWPHHPTMLANGNILVFDNGIVRKHSRVLEIVPSSGDIVWEYEADPPKDFFTPRKGSAQRLPNGNTLICESDRGRAFEVTSGGELVWEWYNPATKDEHRVQVYRMQRYPVEVVEALMSR